MSPPPSAAELVREHGAFVRSLARELCRRRGRSGADADDLVQETWLEALRRPPRSWRSPRGWLAKVARRLVTRHARGEVRRSERERLAALDAEDSSDDLRRIEVLRDVADGLFALEAEDRRRLTARHFEGLELAELARREGVATSTIKLRLARSHEALRRALDDAHDGRRDEWRAGLLLLLRPSAVPTPAPAPEVAPPRGAAPAPTASLVPFLVMSVPLKLALVGAAVVAMGLALHRSNPEPAGALAVLPEGHEVDAEGDTELARVTGEGPRAAVAPPEPVPETAEEAPDYGLAATLAARVTDLDGVPMKGIELLAGPIDRPLNRIGTTSEEGRIEASWYPGSGSAEIAYAFRSGGRWIGGLRRVVVPPGGREELRIAVDPELIGRGGYLRLAAGSRFEVMRGSVISTGSMRIDEFEEVEQERDESEAVERRRPGALVAQPEELEGGVLAFGAAPEPEEERPQVQSALSLGSVRLRIDNVFGDEPVSVVSGTARDLTGEPARGLRVRAVPVDADGKRDESRPTVTARSRAGGSYSLQLGQPGRYELRAGGPGRGGARETIVVAGGDPFAWDPVVDRGLALIGQATYVDGGGPCARATIEASVDVPGGRWLAVVQADDEGQFVVPHCPQPSVRVDVAHKERDVDLPLATFFAVAPGGEPWSAEVDGADFGVISIRPTDDEPLSPLAAEARLWRTGDERGGRASLRSSSASPLTFQIPTGRWSLMLGDQGLSWTERFEVDVPRATEPAEASGMPMVALGRVPLGRVGFLTLDAPAPEAALKLHRVEGDRPPVLVWQGAPGRGALELALPAGRYVVRTWSEDVEVADAREVELLAGRHVRPD